MKKPLVAATLLPMLAGSVAMAEEYKARYVPSDDDRTVCVVVPADSERGSL